MLFPKFSGHSLNMVAIMLRVSFSILLELTLIEFSILKYLTEFIWKRVPPIDHEFVPLFLQLTNFVLSCLLGFVEIISMKVEVYEKIIEDFHFQKYNKNMAVANSRCLLFISRLLIAILVCTSKALKSLLKLLSGFP